jgi:hypothetical protein
MQVTVSLSLRVPCSLPPHKTGLLLRQFVKFLLEGLRRSSHDFGCNSSARIVSDDGCDGPLMFSDLTLQPGDFIHVNARLGFVQ